MKPDWQLIETAPRDGSRVLIYAKPDMAVAQWYRGEDGDEIEAFWAVWDGHDFIPAFRRNLMTPTHWAEEPEPPPT